LRHKKRKRKKIIFLGPQITNDFQSCFKCKLTQLFSRTDNNVEIKFVFFFLLDSNNWTIKNALEAGAVVRFSNKIAVNFSNRPPKKPHLKCKHLLVQVYLLGGRSQHHINAHKIELNAFVCKEISSREEKLGKLLFNYPIF
jgi:hypothetical protein